MKITVIGAGSTYTPELVKGFIERKNTLPLDELVLMDINPERLNIVGGFCQRIVKTYGSPYKVTLSTDRREAIRGASYIITQLRVGMMPARREDEYLGKRYGIVGQETTGIGGMAKALRTIPVILSIARDIQELAPGALLVNFTNPSGLVTEALFRHAPQVKAVGLCNAFIGMKMQIIKLMEKVIGKQFPSEKVNLDVLGLNHLTWYRGFTVDGQDFWQQVIQAYLADLEDSPEPEWDAHMIERLGMIPNGYLQYYYNTPHKLAAQEKWPPSRAEEVLKIEADLLREYVDPKQVEPPADLMKRGGAYYSTLATQVINAHYNNLGEVHVVNVRHNGAVHEWSPDWVLELPCRIDSAGIHPLPSAALPPVCFGLLAQVKSYELLTVEAAVNGDRRAAYQALLTHPLRPATEKIQIALDDLLKTNKAYLPQF